MINHFKYARSRFPYWFSGFAVVIGVLELIQICLQFAITIILSSIVLSFLIPLLVSFGRKEFRIKTLGHSKVTVAFGDLFDEECFVVTTNRYFDIIPDGNYITEDSVLGDFVNRFFYNNTNELKDIISSLLPFDENKNIKRVPYGKTISFKYNDKIVYFMALTDREKSNQPKDFYIKSMRAFLKELSKANHGKIISIPLIGNNNNLSDTGFHSSEMTFESLITMINEFEIENPKSELKLKIVVLPENRADIIKSIALHTRRI